MRIISGTYGGRRVATDDKLPIRPTSDKARGAVFSSIAPLISNARFLDIFAGTGAVGIEALSRGASSVVAVELSPKVARLIHRNCETIGVPRELLSVRVGAFDKVLPTLEGSTFDIIFADPPYDKNYGAAVLELVDAHNLLSFGGVLIIEHFAKETMPERSGRLGLQKVRNYGQTTMSFYIREEKS